MKTNFVKIAIGGACGASTKHVTHGAGVVVGPVPGERYGHAVDVNASTEPLPSAGIPIAKAQFMAALAFTCPPSVEAVSVPPVHCPPLVAKPRAYVPPLHAPTLPPLTSGPIKGNGFDSIQLGALVR